MGLSIVLLAGLIMGVIVTLASRAMSFGVVTDLLGGIVGAFVVNLAVTRLGWTVPFGLAGTAGVALVGAAFTLLLLRGVHSIVAEAPGE